MNSLSKSQALSILRRVLLNLKGNLRVETRKRKEGSDTSYQIRCNEEAERQVLQVRTERTLEIELPNGHQKARYG